MYKKNQIIEGTFNLIADEGFRSLNMAKIAKRVGMAQSSIFYHFKNKDELLNAVLQKIGLLLIDNVEKAKDAHEEASNCLHFLIMRNIDIFRANLSGLIVFFFDSLYYGNPIQKATVQEHITNYLKKVEEIIRQGQTNQTVRSDACPRTLSLIFFGMTLPPTPLSHAASDNYNGSDNVDNIWFFFRRSILPRTGQECEPHVHIGSDERIRKWIKKLQLLAPVL
jgi:AcrR family transcriptional regulator